MTTRVGYIGLGLMGKSMARNLLKAGHPLVVHNRSRAAVDELAAEGAEPAASAKEVALGAEVIFTNLPDSPDVERVVLGPDGVIEGCRPGQVLVDNSTIKPETARALAAALEPHGVAVLDAPVSGGDVGAREGTLSIMVGGPKAAFDKVLPILQTMGKSITYLGESGAGQVAKACNQIMVAAQMVAMGELLLFAQKCGVDPRRVIEAIRGGAAQCWTLDQKPSRLFAGERGPGFRARLMHKDLAIVLDTARRYGMPLPSAAVHTQLFASMLELDMGDLDNSAVIGVLEAMAGVGLTVP
jgi:2-hydroxy-3-oxopropionate reductase